MVKLIILIGLLLLITSLGTLVRYSNMASQSKPLIPMSSVTDPNAANYMGRMEVNKGTAPAGTYPMSSVTNPKAANYMGVQSSPITQSVLGINTPLTGKYTGWGQAEANADAAAGGNTGTSAPSGITDPSTGQFHDNIDDYYRQIDEAYGSSFDYLNKAEGNLRSDLPNILGEMEGNFNVNSAMLKDQLGATQGKFGEQETAANKRKLEADAATRRLYDELRMGYRQRFGGQSSAFQGAGELSSMEQMRQQGKTASSFDDTVREIDAQRVNVQKEYDTGIMQLTQQKQNAINQANRDFQAKLLEIDRNRADINMNKAQARLGALQNLRNQVFQINQQNLQFQQQLQLQREAANQELANYSSKLGASTNATTGAFNQFADNTNSFSSGLNVNSAMSSGGLSPQLTGQISSRKEEPGLMGQIGNFASNSFDWLKGENNPLW